jgi:hypothetical protein
MEGSGMVTGDGKNDRNLVARITPTSCYHDEPRDKNQNYYRVN